MDYDKQTLPDTHLSEDLIVILKKNKEISLKSLADTMNISKVAVLKQIVKLESNGLVDRRYRNSGRGRPSCFFRLTEKGIESFSRGHKELAVEAFNYIEENFGREHVDRILRLRSSRIYGPYSEAISGLDDEKKVERLVELRNSDGYMAEYRNLRGNKFELMEYNCPILAISERYGEACSVETDLFRKLLDSDVTATHRVVSGDNVCRFLIDNWLKGQNLAGNK